MTLYAARRDTRTLDALTPQARTTPIDDRAAMTADQDRRRSDTPSRPSAPAPRRVTRLLPTGLW